MDYLIKLTTPWDHKFFYERTPSNSGIIEYKGDKFIFEIDNNCGDCDFWIVWGGLRESDKSLKAKCPNSNTIFITEERFDERTYKSDFLNQFSIVITGRNDIQHKHIIRSHELNTWHLNKTYDELVEMNFIPKQKMISIVSSDLVWLKGHKKRFAFVNKLIGHFKDKIDVFGRGFNYIENKWDALAPYKYSIAIENNSLQGYFTEKISECFLAHTMPIYYGATNIEEYFSTDTIFQIDIDDYIGSINKIEILLEEDPYDLLLPKIIEQKIKFITEYNFFQKCASILSTLTFKGNYGDKRNVKIINENEFHPFAKKMELQIKKVGRLILKSNARNTR